MDKDLILQKYSFYRDASNSFKEELFNFSTLRHVSAGEYFYNQGEAPQQFFLIGSGQIRIFRMSETGRRITLYRLHKGDTCLINMLFGYFQKEAPCSAIAERDVEAILIPSAKFTSWICNQEVFRQFFFEVMAARIVEVLTLVETIAFRKIDERLADFLLQYLQRDSMNANTIAITHEEIAAELGSAREVISRTLNEFERYGAIQKTRGLIRLVKTEILKERTRKIN